MQLTPDDVALVSGGASGLGRAVVEAVTAAGARAVILDLPSSPGQAAADEIGPNAVFHGGDVTDEESVRAAVATATGLGDLRVVVACAGTPTLGRTVGRDGPFPLAEYQRVIDVNLVGTFNVVRLGAEAISHTEPRDGERGVVVMTASVAAFDGQIGQVAYSASKGGVVGMTLPIARDLSKLLIRVMTVAPGTFDTPMMALLPEEARQSLGAQVPHPSRLGRPAEYADLVMSIVANPMLNGETIRLDGAIRMAPK